MSKKYTGYKEFEQTNLIVYVLQQDKKYRTTLCANVNNFSKLLNETNNHYNFDKKYLAQLLAAAKMVSLVEHYKEQNDTILGWYKNDDRINKDVYNKVLNGEPSTIKELVNKNEEIKDKDTLENLKKVLVNNDRFKQFKEDLGLTFKENGLSQLKEKITTSFTKLGFNQEMINSFFDKTEYVDKNFLKEKDNLKEKFDEQFNVIVNKVEELRLNRRKEYTTNVENMSDSDLKYNFENEYYYQNRNEDEYGIKNNASKSDVLISAVNANVEMKKRLNNSVIKKIPLLRWFSKEFRTEHKLYKNSLNVIENLQGDHDIKGLIDSGANINDIYKEVEQVQLDDEKNIDDPYVVKENKEAKKQVFNEDPDKQMEKEEVSAKVEQEPVLEETKEKNI